MLKHLNRLSTTKALLRLFQRTVRLDRFAPGLSKSMTWRRKIMGDIWYLKTRSYLLVIDFEVGGFYYEGCVIFSLFQLVEQVDERPVKILSKTTWNRTFTLFWNTQRNCGPSFNFLSVMWCLSCITCTRARGPCSWRLFQCPQSAVTNKCEQLIKLGRSDCV